MIFNFVILLSMEPYLSTVSSKGQITIPRNLRDALKLETGQVVLMEPARGGLLLKKAEIKTEGDDFSDGEWEILREMSSKKGKRYSTGKKFLVSLK